MYKTLKNVVRDAIFFNRRRAERRGSVSTILESAEKWITNPTEFSNEGFEVRYRVKKHLYHGVSKFQTIDIIDHENFGRMMFINNDAQIAESDGHIYNETITAPLLNHKNIHDIAILGGGDGGVLYQVLGMKPKSVTMVEIDEEVIRLAKEFFPDFHKNAFDNKKANIVIDDVYTFLDKPHIYDAIIYDLTMHPEEFINIDRKVFLDSLFAKIRKNLRKGGILTLQCSSEFDVETIRIANDVMNKYFTNINFTKVFIPSYCVRWVFGSAEAK